MLYSVINLNYNLFPLVLIKKKKTNSNIINKQKPPSEHYREGEVNDAEDDFAHATGDVPPAESEPRVAQALHQHRPVLLRLCHWMTGANRRPHQEHQEGHQSDGGCGRDGAEPHGCVRQGAAWSEPRSASEERVTREHKLVTEVTPEVPSHFRASEQEHMTHARKL